MQSKISDIFREFLKKYPKLFFILLFTLLVEGAIVAISILSVLPLADYLIDPSLSSPNIITQKVLILLKTINIDPNFWIFGSIFIILNLIKAISNILIRFILLKIKYTILQRLTLDTLNKFFDARWEFFSKSNQGLLINTLNKELTIIGDTLGQLALIISYFFQLIFYLVTPILINYQLTLTTLAMSLLFLFPLFILNSFSYKLGKENTRTANINTQSFTEILQAAKLIIGFGNQNKAKDRYKESLNNHIDATIKSQTLTASIALIVQPLIILAAIISIGLMISDSINIPELSAVFWSLMAALPILGKIIHGRISISNFIPSYEQLNSLRNEASKYKEVSGLKTLNNFSNSIEFKNVTFKYQDRNVGLSNCNMIFKRGDITAITGTSGSGKTTVTDILLGLQKINEGKILVDNENIQNFDLNSLRKKIGYVPQEPFLFNTSIENNLLWSDKKNNGRIQECLKLANIQDFVNQLPEGLKTEVGDRGTRLSGGQKQRIALARALIRKPEILILDEATSSIDDKTESKILSSLNNLKGKITIILIAHRLSTLNYSDEIYVLSKGNIVEKGSFKVISSNKNSLIFQLKKPTEIK